MVFDDRSQVRPGIAAMDDNWKPDLTRNFHLPNQDLLLSFARRMVVEIIEPDFADRGDGCEIRREESPHRHRHAGGETVSAVPAPRIDDEEARYREAQRRERWRRRVLPALGIVGLIALWWAVVAIFQVKPFIAVLTMLLGTANPTPTLPPVEINVFFTNTRPSGTRNPPFNEPVQRMIPGSANSITAALDAYFAGPTSPEQAQGLIAIRNGFVGYRRVDFTDGVLSVYLAGNCQPGGMGYGIAQPLIATLKQFPGVLYVKVYDAYDHTGLGFIGGTSLPT